MKQMFTGDITEEEVIEYYKDEIDMEISEVKRGLKPKHEAITFIRGFNFAWISVNVDFFDKYLDPYCRLKMDEIR